MAYNVFARWYDILNGDANHDRLFQEILARLKRAGVTHGILADLGCGTGELALRLAGAGFDMIAVDASPDMLSVVREKQADWPLGENILLLCQRLEALDLYGTIAGAVSTFDTFNHLPAQALAAALGRTALFTEPGGPLIFDMNTPYKHEQILACNTFEFTPAPGLVCEWENRYDPAQKATEITLTLWEAERLRFTETFWEYSYPLEQVEALLGKAGFEMAEVVDGETFLPLAPTSQRFLISALKK